MASRIGSVLRDQNLNVHFHDAASGWKTNTSTTTKAPKKGGFGGGRTPLGDLSNSIKPSVNQTAKKQNLDATKTTTSSKASAKVGRKALSDISKSGVQNVSESTKKGQSTKLNAKTEERINLTAIAEEGFLHNHQECIKAQRSMDLDRFLQILGLDNDVSEQLKDAQAHVMSAKEEDESSLIQYELEEMIEPVMEVCSGLDSSPASSPHVSPRTSFRWDDEEYVVDFKLIESPKK